ncbi:uncharacterized protein KY384_004159 [Bacidia gigantensis]|uniref:uncharacterized protein n=1 Tax=Bacidia gigantensis TaxID=2732470 RepID=UPI001D037112|nr:uncharacterized protein KY384_004159 [Bacidia gigantensis]KAG8530802.1 hypothetical protein KY384_004159 [Bacidia gigantensis]
MAGPVENGNGKRERGAPPDLDAIIPLLFAAHGDWVPNYKTMALLDKEKHTASALEHKFRKWRQTGREIAAQHPEVVVDAKAPKPRTPKKGGDSEGATNGNGGDDTEMDYTPKTGTKKRTAANGKANGETPTKKSKAPSKKQANGTKAKVAEQDGDGEVVVKRELPKVEGGVNGLATEDMVFEQAA